MQRQRLGSIAAMLLLTAAVMGAAGGPKQAPPKKHVADAPAVIVLKLSGGGTGQGAPAGDMLPDLDVSGLRASMPEADDEAFAAYLPVLRGEQTFRWVEGPSDGCEAAWTPFDASMTDVRDRFWTGFSVQEPPETLTLDRLAVQDIDGDGTAELALLFQDGAYNYLILRREGKEVYGTSLPVRWFEELQTNGVYIGSGGAGDSTYFRMVFRDGRFVQQELGHRIDGAYTCFRELEGREVSRAAFDAWLEEAMPGGVTWYAPGGEALPAGM